MALVVLFTCLFSWQALERVRMAPVKRFRGREDRIETTQEIDFVGRFHSKLCAPVFDHSEILKRRRGT
jgi:hypothetical protein